ncbi:MAG: FISUMP domain-containing protein [bacterium]
MKKAIYILLFLLSYTAYSQSLSVFRVDASNFPTIKAKFIAFDSSGNQITNLNPSDFEVKENGVSRLVTYVSCPEPKPIQNVSIAMSIDVSGSMAGSISGEIPVELGKTTARELCKSVQMPPSEFALQTCDSKALIIQDFTTDKAKLLSKIDPITAYGENDFVEHLMNRLTGLLNIAKNGKYKRVAVLYTDAWWYPLADNELQDCKDTCLKYNIQFFAVIYSRPEAESNGIKQSLQLLADETGGYLYDGVTSTQAAEEIANCLQLQAQDDSPCGIEWQSVFSCKSELTNVEIKLYPNNRKRKTSFQIPNSSLAKLEIIPTSLKLKNATPGIKKDTTIAATARNADFNVTNITSSNPAYTVTPTSFFLTSGQSQNLTVSYIPADSGYTYTKFTIENDNCTSEFYASGGYPGKRAKIKTLKLIQPNGSETYVVGMDTIITWEGVLPEEKVKIEYTTNNGTNWIQVADSATGLSCNWLVPKTPSNLCLARVTANLGYEYSGCDDGELQICNQVWMCANLDVITYRDGTPIPEVTDRSVWAYLTTGAWCYYNNDPELGAIYGKLYNWYAVNDPRGLAPEGWHIPTDSEWSELSNCLGGESIAGGKLKSKGTIENGDGLWYSPNLSASNESKFSALPGGYLLNIGFYMIGNLGNWWSATENDAKNALVRRLGNTSPSLNRGNYQKLNGLSVRCVKD